MTTNLYIFLLACSVLLSGCIRDSNAPEVKASEKEEFRMIQIHNFKVTKESLMLDYIVTNPFTYDIWICEDIDTEGRYDVETRIDIEDVRIKLRFNLESNIFRDPPAFGKYLRLQPGVSCSGRILINLPIRNASPVFDFSERYKNRKQVVLHRAFFEIGYFEGEQINRLSGWFEKTKRYTTIEDLLQFEPLMIEEIRDGKTRKILRCTHIWPGIDMEKSVQVTISNVDIPCSVVFDSK